MHRAWIAVGAGTRRARAVVAAVLLAGGAVVALEAPPATAGTHITVTTTDDVVADDGQCSLREAITAADADQASGALPGECPAGDGHDTILLGDATYTLSRPGAGENLNVTGDLDVRTDVNLVGDASSRVGGATIDAARIDRVLDVHAGNVLLDAVTVTGGRTPDGGDATGPSQSGGQAEGGGGIRNNGRLALVGVRVAGNATGNGGAGGPGRNGGSGGPGGGISNFSAHVTLVDSTVSVNTTGRGGPGGEGTAGEGGGGGQGGSGAGIYNPLGTAVVERSTVSGNTAGRGGPGGSSSGGRGGSGGSGGSGGGILNGANFSGAVGTVTIVASTVSGNTTGDGSGGGSGAPGGFGGSGGRGGGIESDGVLSLTNATVSGNTTGNGGPGGAGGGGSGGSAGSGAGVRAGSLTDAARAELTNVTVTGNRLGGAGAGGPGGGAPGAAGVGAGVLRDFFQLGPVILTNALIASNPGGANCGGSGFTDGGGNLTWPDTSCPGFHADPLLGPLQHHGGPTRTHAPGAGSAAVDMGDDRACPHDDQRGVARPQGPHCDAGAHEVERVDLGVGLGAAPSPVPSGGELTYTATVVHRGRSAADVRLDLVLPAASRFARFGPSAPGCSGPPAGTTGTVSCAFGDLGIGATRTVEVVAVVDAPRGSTVTATAHVRARAPDANEADNTATATTSVTRAPTDRADVAAALADDPDPVAPSAGLRYRAMATNFGPDPARGVKLHLTIPPQSTFVSLDMGPGVRSCAAPPVGSTGTVTCKLGRVGVAATEEVEVLVKVTAPAGSTVSATARVTSTTRDRNGANDSATASTQVRAPA